jgi:hypothetical protein
MEYQISYPGFEGQTLVVKPKTFFGLTPKIICNGKQIYKVNGFYPVKNNSGSEVLIKMQGQYINPVPKITIGNDVIELVPPLKWYDYILIGIPFVLGVLYGSTGFTIGSFGTVLYASIFRPYLSPLPKYVLLALLGLGVLSYFLSQPHVILH